MMRLKIRCMPLHRVILPVLHFLDTKDIVSKHKAFYDVITSTYNSLGSNTRGSGKEDGRYQSQVFEGSFIHRNAFFKTTNLLKTPFNKNFLIKEDMLISVINLMVFVRLRCFINSMISHSMHNVHCEHMDQCDIVTIAMQFALATANVYRYFLICHGCEQF